jgi:protein-disulfide isomerase
MMNKGTAIIGFLLCFLAGMGLMYGIDHSKKNLDVSSDSSVAWSDGDSPVPVDSKDPMWGSRSAPVTIVVFSDFQCPFCSRVEPTMDQVKTTYGKDKVRILWKNEPLPFHPNAKPAAEAAQGVYAMAGNEAFWKFHDTAFKNQSQLSTDSYVKWAKEAGVKDEAKFKAGLEAHTWADKVDKDNAVAKQVGANGTPHFYINGVEVSGAQPFDKFKEVIDAQLSKAQAAIASGTKADKVYVAMSKQNKTNAPEQPTPADKPKKENPEEDDKTVWKVPVGDSPVKGSDNALVTIVEFSDFQCPFCKRVEDTLKKVSETYGDKVRLVWKHEPLSFHPRAEPAAEVTALAFKEKGSKGFWAAHDKLFEIQPKLEDDDLANALKEATGIDPEKAKKAISSHKFKDLIDADANLGDDVNASGTPHFFINGRRLVGAQPFEKFQSIIDEEIKNAQALVAKGTPASKVYQEIMKNGKEPPPPEKKTLPAPTSANPYKGGANAKVVIQEFSDFQCPFCGRVEPTVKQIMDTYGDKVKFVWRHKPLPMHPDAPLASEATEEAFKQKGSDGFWKMHDILFQNQSTPDGLKRPALEKYAEQLGLDMTKFKAAMDSTPYKAKIDADSKVGDDAGISGTPAFVINGYFVSGAQPFPKFKKLIDRALAEAK